MIKSEKMFKSWKVTVHVCLIVSQARNIEISLADL